MNVIIQINGREAIPVRAIPLLTNWTVLGPDELVEKLKQGLINSRHLDKGDAVTIRQDWWVDTEVALYSLSETMQAKQCDYADWQVRSTQLLPESVFVWRSEFEQFFHQAFVADNDSNPEYFIDMRPAMLGINFKPLVSRAIESIVMQGFDALVVDEPVQRAAGPDVVLADAVVPASEGAALDSEKPAIPNWKMQIQAEATELYLKLLASGANPTTHSLLAPMAQWCRDNEVKTNSKINPSEGYLRTHVLGGKNWTPPTMTREQAKKHVAQVAQTKVAQVAH